MSENKKIRQVEFTPKFEKIIESKQLLRRVAVYARVSTERDQQQTSFKTQVDFYTKKVNETPEWELVKIYEDEGISGCGTKKRAGFQEMIADCEAGKIDLIITKSVSRFARNTVDSIETIRKLKAMGIEIYFEKENIWTLDTKSEFIITLMSSLAQEESRSLSENVTWGKRKRMAEGSVSIPYARVLGFKKGKEGIEVDKQEAETVKRIFKMFLQGYTPHAISKILTKEGIKSPSGMEKWYAGPIRAMLSNEKYKGDALLQKEFTVDYLTKKMKKNEGELPQYYVKENHEAIIDPSLFDYIQIILQKRIFDEERESRYSGVGLLNSKLMCAECGAFFGPRTWHPNSTHEHIVWECPNRYKEKQCKTVHIYDEYLKYIIHDVAKKEVVERNIVDVLLRISRYSLKTEVFETIKNYLNNFGVKSIWKMYSDLEDLILLVDEIKVSKKNKLEIKLIDEEKIEYRLFHFSPTTRKIMPRSEYCTKKVKWEVKVERKEIAYCESCKKEMQQNPRGKLKRFCCAKCRNKWWNKNLDKVNRKAYYEYICKNCQKEFVVYGNSKRKFCSHECYQKFYAKEVNETDVVEQTVYHYTCKECGRDFSSCRKRRIYCSKKCSTAYEIRKWQEARKKKEKSYICRECGIEFKSCDKNRKYCSRECFGKVVSRNMKRK
ncbi:DNA invertase Pin-like site-specific DNA recombinase [Streptococcus gallinaceus]|uniref:recombinase family protein n=1 Tax=Streptococcus gallinaceus TaxID=165758 RepID=UPI00209E2B1A|nr:recombinase family protein [Streptococcus gallinaceus]MCP1638570.1 DNA invertase Pin-like site-specific DNA recombinase [Streptococcus gallinaceus]MCP1769343.1 DNA invertase Pin-like site-specific DNA recombinase [Streptococcus gallinaceus]